MATQEYQPVIPMAEFSDQLAPAHWKREKRVAHCVNLDPDHKCQHMYNPPGQELWYMHLIQFATTKAITVPTTVRRVDPAGSANTCRLCLFLTE